jgi:hypothetical protein
MPKLSLDVTTPEGTAQESVAFLLNCQITVHEGAPMKKFHKEKDSNIVISLSELPHTGNSSMKFQTLLLKRIGREKVSTDLLSVSLMSELNSQGIKMSSIYSL